MQVYLVNIPFAKCVIMKIRSLVVISIMYGLVPTHLCVILEVNFVGELFLIKMHKMNAWIEPEYATSWHLLRYSDISTNSLKLTCILLLFLCSVANTVDYLCHTVVAACSKECGARLCMRVLSSASMENLWDVWFHWLQGMPAVLAESNV